MVADDGMPGLVAYEAQLVIDQANLLTNRIGSIHIIPGTGEIQVVMLMTQLGAGTDMLAYLPQIGGAPLSPVNLTGTLEWVCDSASGASTSIANNYLPAVCR